MSRCLLSVNGHRAMNFLLQTIFEKDFQFLPADDPYQALQLLKGSRSVEAIIVDVDFQPQQNWEFIQHIKSSRLYQAPVIILSSGNADELKQKCINLDIDEIFFKPFNPVDLITAIKRINTGLVAHA